MRPDSEPSIGADIVEICRFRNLGQDPRFLHRVFSERELAYCFSYADPAPHLAATFAAKEAVLKAMYIPVRMNDMEILRDATGAPSVEWVGTKKQRVAVSLSHSADIAAAVALVIPDSEFLDPASVQSKIDLACQQLVGSHVT